MYPADAVRRDYRRGLILAITFTLFAMPRLTDEDEGEEEVDGGSERDRISLRGVAHSRLMDALRDVVETEEFNNC